jgi:hypothetical protein
MSHIPATVPACRRASRTSVRRRYDVLIAMTERSGIIETLELLACDISARPKDAPALDALSPHILHIQRAPGALTIDVEASALDVVEAFAAAERLCCSTLGFDVTHGDPVRLRITATPELLDAFANLIQATS